MNRKRFVGSGLGLILGSKWMRSIAENPVGKNTLHSKASIIPPFLKSGDCIGIVSPAGTITREEIQPAIGQLEAWGYRVKVGTSIGKKDFTFGGTDQERLEDLQHMLDDASVKAIMLGRGGYGLVRIIDQINFDKFIQNPKWIIGFSDACVLHFHIHQHFGIATVHAKMCNSFLKDKSKMEANQVLSIASINDCLTNKKIRYNINQNNNNRHGIAQGELIGGNLRLLENVSGTNSDIDTNGKILFLEDTEEYLYNIDRMFWNLKRTGKLKGLKGLIIGGFKIKPDDPGEAFGLTLEQIVMEKVKEYNYPVCFDFPVGHQKHNVALVCGTFYELIVTPEMVELEMMLTIVVRP
jgi:muramoyltetrapeptide carboxypeptidase